MTASISPQAEHALKHLLTRCLQECVRSDDYSTWEMQPVANAAGIAAREFIMLTISSYDFRLFVLLHFSNDPASTRYVANALKMTPEQLATTRYYDYIGELGNRFCGAFKRELGRYVPHLGMSTPNRLPNDSVNHLKDLSFDYDTHIRARADGDTDFYASLYVSAYGKIDSHVSDTSPIEEPVEAGALELF